MIASLILLQAAAAIASPETRAKYEPLRRCLAQQVGPAAAAVDKPDDALLEQAMSQCLAANLSSGTAFLFAETGKGATKQQALERGARLREEAEREFLANVHALRSRGGASEAAPLSGPVIAAPVMLGRFSIPDEIAPAVAPYMNCLLTSRGSPIRGVAPPPGISRGSGCSANRAAAAKAADKMLKSAGRGTRAQRRDYIESVLAGADRFAGTIPQPLPGTKAQ